MMAVVEKLQAGEELTLCPFCQRMNALAKAGAAFENVDTEGAHILAVTSNDAAMVEKIHDYQKWAQEQMAAMEGAPDHGG